MARRLVFTLLLAGSAALVTFGALQFWQRTHLPMTARVLPRIPPTIPTGPRPRWKGPDLTAPGKSGALDLTLLDPELSLAPTARPNGEVQGAKLIFHDPEPFGGTVGWYQITLPFSLPQTGGVFSPDHLKVTVDGVQAEYKPLGLRREFGRSTAWRLGHTGEVVVLHNGVAHAITIEHPNLLDMLAQLDPAPGETEGADALAFARGRVQIGDISRLGWSLPAPASARWHAITLPQGAHFLAFPTLKPAPTHDASDGVRFDLLVTSGEKTDLAGHIELPAHVGGFVRWEIDLSAWAGQTVDLTVRVDPKANSDFDYAFLGTPRIHTTDGKDVRRVIVVGVDTLRADRLGIYGSALPTSPDFDTWAANAVVFDHAFTTAPRTRPAFRASTTGRLPHNAVCSGNISEAFQKAGFATAGIVANVHLNPRFGFDKGFDLWWLDTQANATTQVDRGIAWLQEHQKLDTYLFLHIMDPHIFYEAPEPWGTQFSSLLPALAPQMELPPHYNRWMVYRWLTAGQLSPLRKAHIAAAYAGEVAYTTQELTRFLRAVDELPGRSTVIIHNDHGEEFFEHGGFEHNHTLYNEVVRGVFVVKPPGGSGVKGAHSPAPASLEDIAPTLYELAGLTDTPPTDGVSLVPALRGEPMDPDRPIGVAHLKYDRDQWGVIWRQHKYVLVTGTGDEHFYDLEEDPGELHDLAQTEDTSAWLEALGRAHHLDAGPGWRIQIQLQPHRHAEITLPAPARDAGVLDPERVTPHQANQVWGERPTRTLEDVGSLTLSEDHTQISFTGGSDPTGVLWVRFDTPPDPDLTRVQLDASPVEVTDGRFQMGSERGRIYAGPLLVPPETEILRIERCEQGQNTLSDLERKTLEALGYIGGDASADEVEIKPGD